MPKHSSKDASFGLKFGTVAGIFAGAYQAAEIGTKLRALYDVPEDTRLFMGILARVRIDLAEAERLMAVKQVKFALSKSPAKVQWIKKTISSMKEALEGMHKLSSKVKDRVENGRFHGIWGRVSFITDDQDKLNIHTQQVARSHAGLLEVIGFLSSLEPLACCDEAKGVHGGQQHRGDYDDHEDYFEEKDVVYDEPPRPRVAFKEERHYENREFDQRTEAPQDWRTQERTTERYYDRPYEGRDEAPQGREQDRYVQTRVEERYTDQRGGAPRERTVSERVEQRYVDDERDYQQGQPRARLGEGPVSLPAG